MSVIPVLMSIDSGGRGAQWYVFALSIACSLVTDGFSLQSLCEMKQCLRTLSGKKEETIKLSKPLGISTGQVQCLNVGWAEVVSVDHIVKFLRMIMTVRSCVEI